MKIRIILILLFTLVFIMNSHAQDEKYEVKYKILTSKQLTELLDIDFDGLDTDLYVIGTVRRSASGVAMIGITFRSPTYKMLESGSERIRWIGGKVEKFFMVHLGSWKNNQATPISDIDLEYTIEELMVKGGSLK